MNDRELLERAARAEGTVYSDATIKSYKDGGPVFLIPFRGFNWQWDPLEDDAQAFQLAVKLHLYVRFHEALQQAIVSNILGDEWCVDVEDCGRDPCAATRRAIVLAAAGENPTRTAAQPSNPLLPVLRELHGAADGLLAMLITKDATFMPTRSQFWPALKAAGEVLKAAERVKCDGNHGGPPCADPECWSRP